MLNGDCRGRRTEAPPTFLIASHCAWLKLIPPKSVTGAEILSEASMIRKLKSGYRLYSRKKNPKTGKRRNLGTFKTKAAAKKHEKDVQYFKRR
jgi:hypothetical protein